MKNRFHRIAEQYRASLENHMKKSLASDGLKPKGFCAEMAHYHLSTGGKRIRALIPLAVFEAFGTDPELALPLGCAVEMIHNATLVHDDLQDGDQVRRGQPTVWKKYSEAQAVNCGDAMFFYALRFIHESSFSLERKSQIQALAVQATLNVIEGQAQEFRMKQESFPGVDRYLEVVGGKTSGLFGLPIAAALVALGVEPQIVGICVKRAERLGIVFQIQDDLIDIYGEKNRDQKATDIAEGKISFLVATINQVGSLKDKENLSRILSTSREETTRTQISEAIDIFEKYQAKVKAGSFIEKVRQGISSPKELSHYPQMKQIFLELSEFVLTL